MYLKFYREKYSCKNPEAELKKFFVYIVDYCLFEELTAENCRHLFCVLTDFYYMAAAFVNRAHERVRDGGADETKKKIIALCQSALDDNTHYAKVLHQFLSQHLSFLELQQQLPLCFSVKRRMALQQFTNQAWFKKLEEVNIQMQMQHSAVYAGEEEHEHMLSYQARSNLGTALSILEECLYTLSDEYDESSTVENLAALLGDEAVHRAGVDGGVSADEAHWQAEIVTAKYAWWVRLHSVEPCLLIQRNVSAEFEPLYEFFKPVCRADTQYRHIGVDQVTFYFEHIRCLNKSKGTIIFLADLFQEHSQCIEAAKLVTDHYDYLLIDNQGVGRTTYNLTRVPSVSDMAENILQLIMSYAHTVDTQFILVGIGFGALLGIELQQKLQPHFSCSIQNIFVDLPLCHFSKEQYRFYSDLADALSILNCMGIAALTQKNRTDLINYLTNYYQREAGKVQILIEQLDLSLQQASGIQKPLQNLSLEQVLQGLKNQLTAYNRYNFKSLPKFIKNDISSLLFFTNNTPHQHIKQFEKLSHVERLQNKAELIENHPMYILATLLPHSGGRRLSRQLSQSSVSGTAV